MARRELLYLGSSRIRGARKFMRLPAVHISRCRVPLAFEVAAVAVVITEIHYVHK